MPAPPPSSALFGEPGMPAPRAGWQRSAVSALFADEAGGHRGGDAAARAATGPRTLHVAGDRSRSPTQDWVRLTQSQFAPVEITPGFWIVPSWHEPPAAARDA